MAGIYFHIPFCKQKCSYCDFYSIRDSDGIDALVKVELKELDLRQGYLNNEIIDTIYFGGGTPSLLNKYNIDSILKHIQKIFDVSADCEITFETNPDDLSEDYLKGLYDLNINRLSVGIQSFNDDILNYLGRRHDSSKLRLNIETAKKVGFENISVDLIFGIPGMELATYLDSLNKVIELDVQHVSAYSLTISEGTLFFKLKKQNKLKEIDEEDLLVQFNSTIDILATHGFNHYEISNYAKEGYKSRHNCSYWEDVNYLGIGPSAHSYNGVSRQWNISDTRKYCKLIDQLEAFFEVEFLTRKDKYNEYIITGLRTSKGISRKFVKDNFDDGMNCFFNNEVNNLLREELIYSNEDSVILTRRGILISDYILQLLYFV
ncbi:MAG TPA: radical SAM family heme chaperone HemW [Paludibacter sp.]